MAGYKKRSYPKSRRSYKKRRGSRAMSRVPRNAFTQKGTTFTLARTYILSADDNGILAPVWALGNTNTLGWASYDYVPTATGTAAQHPAHTNGQLAWPSGSIGNISAVFNSHRTLKHSITFSPLCVAGDSETCVPVESTVQRFGVDSSAAAGTLANVLTDYGSASYSKVHSPSNGRMPGMSFTCYPSKSGAMSVADRQMIPFTGSGLQQAALSTTTGNVNSARTFAFLKLYASDLAARQTCFRVVEKITILCASRKN